MTVISSAAHNAQLKMLHYAQLLRNNCLYFFFLLLNSVCTHFVKKKQKQ